MSATSGQDLHYEVGDGPKGLESKGINSGNREKLTIAKFSATHCATAAGAASGLIGGVFVCPFDVVKTRRQAQGALLRDHPEQYAEYRQKYRGFLRALSTIVHEEGPRGLYRGLVPIIIGYLPTWTIYFTIYEKAKRVYPDVFRKYLGLETSALTHCSSAMTAGMVSSIAVNPVWVVKTRLMIQTNSAGLENSLPHHNLFNQSLYKGTYDAFRRMYKEEGISVFYSGLVPSLFGLFHVGIQFPVYEKLKHLLGYNQNTEGGLLRLILASSLSKMVASGITYPHEILRTRMQLQSHFQRKKARACQPSNSPPPSNKSNIIRAIVTIFKKEGFPGFYAGFAINLIRTLPATSVTLVTFEYIKNYLSLLGGEI